MLRNVLCFAVPLVLTLPAALGAQQFGGARRVEVSPAYPYTAVGKWTYGDGGSRTQFEASDGQRFQVRNVRADHGDAKGEAGPREPDLDVAFGQIVAPGGQPPPGEKYGRFGFDEADTVAASAGFIAHCSFGFSHNEEGKGGRGTLDPDVYVWGSMRRQFPATATSDEFFLHMANGVYGTSGSPIFRCLPSFNAGKLLGVEVGAPARIVGVFIRLNNEKDGLKFADRLRVDPKDMAWGIGGRQLYPYLLGYVKQHPCETLR
ncbi:MAG: hypothetical protein HYX38_05620 [Rhodospirillales bacterium]|nr:hypothetical protein [Rhodospirillales bacterium]